MATLRITEYDGVAAIGPGQTVAPAAREPATASQSVTYDASTASSAFNADTRLVKLHPVSAGCYVAFGLNPTATASSEYLAPDIDHWRGVTPGHKVAAYDGSS